MSNRQHMRSYVAGRTFQAKCMRSHETKMPHHLLPKIVLHVPIFSELTTGSLPSPQTFMLPVGMKVAILSHSAVNPILSVSTPANNSDGADGEFKFDYGGVDRGEVEQDGKE